MRKKSLMKKILTVFTSIMILLSANTVTAAGDVNYGLPDLSGEAASLKVTCRAVDDDVTTNISGVELELTKVADLTVSGGNANYTMLSQYEGSGLDLNQIEDAEGYLNAAQRLDDYRQANDIHGTTVTTDSDGVADFGGPLTYGMYLVSQVGRSGQAANYEYIEPFLVRVPDVDPNTKEWIYDVEANPKTEWIHETPTPVPSEPPTPTTDTVTVNGSKQWVGTDGSADTSDHPTIYLALFRSVEGGDAELVAGTIRSITTASGSSYENQTWSDLPRYDSEGREYTYTVKEVDESGNDAVPVGYTKSESGTTVTNTKTTEFPHTGEVDITATKQWVLNGGSSEDTGTHPTIYFALYRKLEGSSDEPVAVEDAQIMQIDTANGEWQTSVTWTELPDVDEDGNTYVYSVKEVDENGNDYTPSGYTKTEDGTTVINKKISIPDTGGNTPIPNTGGNTPLPNTGKSLLTSVKTGDTSNLILWLALVVISAGVIVMIVRRRNKASRE